MKCFWKKKTITEKQQCQDMFSILPQDLLLEIFMKLPAKSIAKLIFVSKHWSSIIRSKDFMKLYMTRSSTQSRFLFHVGFKNMSHVLESCSQRDSYSDLQKVNITERDETGSCEHVRGLICYSNKTKVMIANPSTGQFITLPKVTTRKRYFFTFFGYDHVNDVYKVLCITKRESRGCSNEHQVFTLGPKQKWRKITCKHPHHPSNISNYINGIVYYYVWMKDEDSLICFDFTSEDFNFVKLPLRVGLPSLANYYEKLAIIMSLYTEDTLELLVLQDVKKQEWLKVSHLITSTGSFLMFKGTLSTGQLIFAPFCYGPINPYFFISYDPKENNSKTIVIKGNGQRLFTQLYLDHVETPMVLPKL